MRALHIGLEANHAALTHSALLALCQDWTGTDFSIMDTTKVLDLVASHVNIATTADLTDR